MHEKSKLSVSILFLYILVVVFFNLVRGGGFTVIMKINEKIHDEFA